MTAALVDDFDSIALELSKIDLRAARVIAAEEVPKAKKILKLTVSLGGDELVGVVATVNRGADGGDGIRDLGVRHNFVHKLAVGEVDDMDDPIATAESNEPAVDDGGGAVDKVVGFVGPDF